MNTERERETAQRRFIVEVVVTDLKMGVVHFAAERLLLALGRLGVASPDLRPVSGVIRDMSHTHKHTTRTTLHTSTLTTTPRT